MTVIAEVVTPWVGDGLTKETGFRPQLKDDYTVSFNDTTGQPSGNLPPDPNIYVVWVTVEPTVLDTIESDNTYYVLWREDGAGEVPPANEFGQLRSFLAGAGVSQSEIDAAIGASVGGRSRENITDQLKEWMRGLHQA